MIDPLISVIVTVLGWVLGLIADVALAFSYLSYYAADIPVVGTTLASYLAEIAGFFDDLWFNVRDFSTGVQDVLNAIDAWLDNLKDLWDQVFGWLVDKIHDAYDWAKGALDWIVDTGQDLWDEVHGWISDKLQDAYEWATNALDWIADFPSYIAPILDDLKAAILSPIAPFINLISFFFDDINLFFSDPLGFILSRLIGIAKKYEQTLLDIADKIGDALFGD